MALRVAVANGSWSNPTTWNGGVFPSPGDIVASNNFTVTIDQGINVATLTNSAQNAISETASMTSNTTPSGIASSNDEGYGTFAWQAFANNVYQGGDSNSRWITFGGPTVSTPIWLAYEFTTPKVIVKYEIRHSSASVVGQDPRDWTFEAWDGTTWIILDTRTNQTHTTINVEFNIVNSTAYSKYRINITSAVTPGGNVQIHEFRMFSTTLLQSAISGGGFILNQGITINATGSVGLLPGSTDLITYNAAGSASILCGLGIIYRPTSTNTAAAIRLSGGGTLTVSGELRALSNNTISRAIYVSTVAGATLNFTGSCNTGATSGIVTDVVCTINYTGDVFGFTSNGPGGGINFLGGGTLNITGNIYGSTSFNNDSGGVYITNGTLNLTGNTYGSSSNPGGRAAGIYANGTVIVNITGNIIGGSSTAGSGHAGVYSITSITLNHIGSIIGQSWPGLITTNSTSKVISTGPFISSEYGAFPFAARRLHLNNSPSTYLEMRNSTTNGAFFPSPAAPIVKLVSPAAAVDAPSQSDVRFGVTYALGTQTGTLHMPHPNQVTFGVAVDNTFGNAVLTAASVWDYLVSNITVENSIGMRLKNVATPQSVGEQLEAFLRLD